jgi:GNAT superfamily N-acetyltransferase
MLLSVQQSINIKMKIRKAQATDSEKIIDLLGQLEYTNTRLFIKNRIKQLLNDPNEVLLVAENQDGILAFISVHFIPQIACEGDFARISYFVVDESHRNKGLGTMIEEHCEQLARSRKCDRIELHCHSRREQAYKFYVRQGYEDSPKYLVKFLERDPE